MERLLDILGGSRAAMLVDVLLHFIWQALAIGAAVYLASAICRSRSANARYAVACLGIAVLAVWNLLGLLAVRKLACQGTRPAPADLHARMARLADRIGVTRSCEVLVSQLVQVPTVIGSELGGEDPNAGGVPGDSG